MKTTDLIILILTIIIVAASRALIGGGVSLIIACGCVLAWVAYCFCKH